MEGGAGPRGALSGAAIHYYVKAAKRAGWRVTRKVDVARVLEGGEAAEAVFDLDAIAPEYHQLADELRGVEADVRAVEQ